MNRRGVLVVFSGPSGVGKDTILRRYMEQDPDAVLSVSATTRPPRPGEVDGVDYHFMRTEDFAELASQSKMLESAQYSGHFYGTPREAVERQLAEGKRVILEIEVQGAMQVQKLCPDALFVFVMPPSWDCLRERLGGRGTETDESLRERLAAARVEIQYAHHYHYILINDELDRCVSDLGAVITAAGCSVDAMRDFIEEVASHA